MQPPQIWPGWYNQDAQQQQQHGQTYQYYPPMVPTTTWPPTYYPAPNTLRDNPGARHTNRRENDQEWVNEWARKLNKHSGKIKQQSQRNLSIPDAKSQLGEAMKVLHGLSLVHDQLKEMVSNGDKTLWDLTCEKAAQLRERFDALEALLAANNEQVDKKLRKIHKKRIRNRKRNEELKREARNAAEMRANLHRDLDEWQNQIYERVKRNKREEELKKEADSILSEVRKKISESRRALELVRALQKLRMLKKQSAERRGLYTTKDSDDKFGTTTNSLEKMLEVQLGDYQDEEKALCVMLDREAEKKEASDLRRKLGTIEANLAECLFGNSDISPDDPIYPYALYYTQADRNLDSLLCIRQVWDSYCAHENEGNSVPFQWVEPTNPSNDNWRTVSE